MTDQEQSWLEQALQGDRASFGHLVEAYQRPVFNLAYQMLGDPDEAEDAAQEAFLRAYSKLESYDPKRKFATWLLSITSHHCIDRLRRRRYTLVDIDETPAVVYLVDEGDHPEQVAERRENQAEVRRLLDSLDPNYRQPVVLRYWHDCSYQEIAEIMGITESAVKSRLHRARSQLAELANQAGAGRASLPQTETTTPASQNRLRAQTFALVGG